MIKSHHCVAYTFSTPPRLNENEIPAHGSSEEPARPAAVKIVDCCIHLDPMTRLNLYKRKRMELTDPSIVHFGQVAIESRGELLEQYRLVQEANPLGATRPQMDLETFNQIRARYNARSSQLELPLYPNANPQQYRLLAASQAHRIAWVEAMKQFMWRQIEALQLAPQVPLASSKVRVDSTAFNEIRAQIDVCSSQLGLVLYSAPNPREQRNLDMREDYRVKWIDCMWVFVRQQIEARVGVPPTPLASPRPRMDLATFIRMRATLGVSFSRLNLVRFPNPDPRQDQILVMSEEHRATWIDRMWDSMRRQVEA